MTVNGTYEHVKDDNLGTLLKAIGVSEEKIQKLASSKPVINVTLAGDTLTIVSTGADKVENIIKLGAPSTFKFASGLEIEVNLTMSGNTAKGTLKKGEKSGEVSVDFEDTGLTETFTVGGVSAKRIFKKK